MIDKELLKAIDACRPGSDDININAPEMAELAELLRRDPAARELYQRVQQIDTDMKATMEDVPVPDGLKQRLAARLEAASGVVPSGAGRRPAARTGWLLGTGAALATTACLSFLIFNSWRPAGPEYDIEEIQRLTLKFYQLDSLQEHIVKNEPPSDSFPLSEAVVGSTLNGWREIQKGVLDQPGVAYHLAAPDGSQAVVLVVRMSRFKVRDLPYHPQPANAVSTGGVWATAWGEGNLLFVLVIRDGSNYHDFLVAHLTVI